MRYLVLREGTYQYRRRVPADIAEVLGQKFWKQSLKSASVRDAEIKARALGAHHDCLIKKIRELPPVQKLQIRRDMLERRQVEAILRITRAERGERWASTATHRAAASVVHNQRIHVEEALKSTLEATVEGAPALVEQLKTLEAERRLDAVQFAVLRGQPCPKGENEQVYDTLRREYAALSETQRQKALEEKEDKALLRPARERRLRKALEPITKAGLALQVRDDPQNPRLNTATQLWFEAKKQGDTATKRHRVAVRRFAELFGDIPVRDVTRQMVRDFVDRIGKLADHRKVPTEQRGGLFDIEGLPRVSAKTTERHLVSIKALLTFCKSQGWVTENVASGIPPPKDTRPKASKRRAFTREERTRVLARSVEENGENGDMTWLIKLAAYTGCRLGELAQLARTNVRRVDGVSVIEIDDLDGRNVKSPSSVRLVPLHPAIRDTFVEWVRTGKGERVFNSFKAEHGANRLSGEFGRLMDRAGLSDPRLVFHSLRHSLKREMSDARIDIEARKAILGHAATDAHGEYEGHSLQALAKELALVPPLF